MIFCMLISDMHIRARIRPLNIDVPRFGVAVKYKQDYMYLGRRLVLITVPSARTTVKLITQSFMVP